MTPYQQKANSIINQSIKSAIFIDDNALEFYGKKSDKDIPEEDLSISLYNNFKQHGVSLAVHKFEQKNIDDKKLKDYLFAGRDLVLLDWKLDGLTGEDKSLQLLEDIVKSEHIHFCAIYTSEENLDGIFDNVISYFSGRTAEFYNNLKEQVGDETFVNEILGKIDIYSKEITGKLTSELTKGDNQDFLTVLKEVANTNNITDALILLKIAYSDTLKSGQKNPEPEIISKTNKTLVINNTIITLLQKNADSDPEKLIGRLSEQVSGSKNSFTQLLGLEMQNIFASKGAFVDSNLFQVSKQTLIYHRKKLIEEDGSDVLFNQMMKSVLLEHAALNLSSSKLSLLDNAVMDDEPVIGSPSDEELSHMNVFYNSLVLEKNKKLNFGDVFIDENKDYYMCITALCDCFRPSKIKNIYYFVKGSNMKRDTALKLGDTAFVNFLSFDQAVVWSNIDQEGGDEKLAKYQPVYIKPLTFQVKNFKMQNGEIELRRIIDNDAKDTKGNIIGEDIEFSKINYVTTIKPTYAQRIANHAFAHPMRVGVDFVKKEIPKKAVGVVAVTEAKSAE
jgi:hypothetical protein